MTIPFPMPARLFLLLLCLVTSLPMHAQEPDLRLKLERAYEQWRSAVLAQDARAWAAAITMHRQVITRNTVISQGLAFPKSVFETMLAPADTKPLRLLEAQSVGDTAHLLYFGKVNMGGDPEQIPESLLVLKFFRQDGAWKFDSNKLIQLASQPEVRAKLLRNEPADFLDLPEFTPPGTAPATPPLSPVPDYITGCTVQSVGYETEIQVNGFDHYAGDNTLKFFILGGLKKGENQITLNARPIDIPKDVTRSLEIDFFVKPQAAGEQGRRVFHYELNGVPKSAQKSTWTLPMPAAKEMSVIDVAK